MVCAFSFLKDDSSASIDKSLDKFSKNTEGKLVLVIFACFVFSQILQFKLINLD